MILVTGATGKLGRHVIDALLERVPASQIVAGARSPQKAADIAAKGVEVRELDYNKHQTVTAALRGIDKLLLISGNAFPRLEGHRAVVDAAKAAGVKLIVYTSAPKADKSRMILAKDHAQSEAYIRVSGIPFTFLRNSWYTENYSEHLGSTLQHGAMLGAAGNGKVSIAPRVDYAEAAAAVLTTDGHEGKIYELGGDTGYTLAEIAAEVARLSGKPVVYKDLPVAEFAATLQQFGLPEPAAKMLADADAGLARGDLFVDSGDLRKLIGRPTTPLTTTLETAIHKQS